MGESVSKISTYVKKSLPSAALLALILPPPCSPARSIFRGSIIKEPKYIYCNLTKTLVAPPHHFHSLNASLTVGVNIYPATLLRLESMCRPGLSRSLHWWLGTPSAGKGGKGVTCLLYGRKDEAMRR